MLTGLIAFLSCTKEILLYCDESDLKECKVAVVLPLSDGQGDNWKQCLDICSKNLADAFCKTGIGVKLVYEWYDEQSPNLREIAEEISSRPDIKAVIGGQYSDDDHILLIMEDDLARKSAHMPQVLESDADDNVFVFWSGHGGPGFLEFGDSYITRGSIDDCLDEMEKVGNYRQSIWFIEACYSGSVAKAADNHNHIIAITAAGEDESSKGDEYNPKWKVWMSNRFSATLQDCMKTDPDMALSDLYYRLFLSTVGSHVHVYGIQGYGSLYSHTFEEIF